MARTLMQPNMWSVPSQIGSFEDKEIRTFLAKAQLNWVLDGASKDASSSRLPSRLLKNNFGTGATQHSRRSGTASEQPAGWSKRPSSAAAASEKAKGGWGGRRGGVLCSVRRASKRRENKAGGPFGYAQGRLFQQPARPELFPTVATVLILW